MKTILVCLLLLATARAAETIDLSLRDGQVGPVSNHYPAGTPVVREYHNLQYPESTYFDDSTASLFISNINGPGLAKDGNGWIAKVSTEPLDTEARPWVRGLNAPKGMASFNGTLWVADIDELVGIDIKGGRVKTKILVPGAKLLNDVVIDGKGVIYVSDTFTSSIHQVVDGKVSLFESGDRLNSPNGLVLDGDRLIVTSYGLTAGKWVTPVPGALYALDLKTKKRTDLLKKKDFQVLDGLLKFEGDHYLFTEGPAGTVHLGDLKSGTSRPLITGVWGAADIGYSPAKKLLAIPRLDEDKVVLVRMEGLSWKEAQAPVPVTWDPTLEKGRIKASVGFCIACHGARDTAFLPIIKGQKEEYLVKAIKDFRSGERQNPLMNPPAGKLTDEEVAYLAKFFASRPAPKSVHRVTDEASYEAGKKISLATCVSCHGVEALAADPTLPKLSGQRKAYLVKTLTDFKTGLRKNEVMKTIVDELSEKDVSAVAEYYSNLEPGDK